MKAAPFLLFSFLLLPTSSYAFFKSLEERGKIFAAWAELKYDQFMRLQPSFKDLKEFKKVQDNYNGNLESYYFGEGIFKKTPYDPSLEKMKSLINNLPDASLPDDRLPNYVITYIQKQLNNNGIDPKKVYIKHENIEFAKANYNIDIPYLSPNNEILITINSCFIAINNNVLPSLPKKAIKATLNHEITHLIKGHAPLLEVYVFALEQISNKKDLETLTREHSQEIRIAHEYQADLSPGINYKKNAQRGFCLSSLILKANLNIKSNIVFMDTPTHPSDLNRYRKVKQLCNFHTIKDQMKTYSIDELINRFKAQRQEMRIS